MRDFQVTCIVSQDAKPGFADNIVETSVTLQGSDALNAAEAAVRYLTEHSDIGEASWDGISISVQPHE